MLPQRRRLLWLGLLFLAPVFFPAKVQGQAGIYATPSLTITEFYSDNIEFTPSNRLKDWVTRIGPGLQVGYESAPLTLLGGYNFDAEIFAHLSDFTTSMARQKAFLDFRYLPVRPLTLSLKGEYIETQTPGELNVLSGVPTGRSQAQRFLFEPSVAYRFDRLTTGTLGYTFTKDEAGDLTTDTHVGKLAIDRQITRLDHLGLEYIFTQFLFRGEELFILSKGDTKLPSPLPVCTGAGAIPCSISVFRGRDTVLVHSIGPRWTRELTPLTTVSLRVGPRFSEGSVDAEVDATIRHRFKSGEVSFTYARTQASVVGESGTVDTDGVTLEAKYRILPPLEISAAPSFHTNKQGTAQSDVYRIKLEANYRLYSWLSLVGSYEWVHQNGILLPPAVLAFPAELAAADFGRHVNTTQNVFALSLVGKFRTRLY
ncbi:MAG: hypothetical protein HY695_20285 [Deltaproteobacteria bacterium]|nr:hypothetical protein [Deltaproteobacteria bacterium]